MNLREWALQHGVYPGEKPRKIVTANQVIYDEIVANIPTEHKADIIARLGSELIRSVLLSGELDTSQPIFLDCEIGRQQDDWRLNQTTIRMSLEIGVRPPYREPLSSPQRPSEAITPFPRGIDQ